MRVFVNSYEKRDWTRHAIFLAESLEEAKELDPKWKDLGEWSDCGSADRARCVFTIAGQPSFAAV